MPAPRHERALSGDNAPLGILAGGGSLPRQVAEAALAAGRSVFIVAYPGQTEPATVDGMPHSWVRLGAASKTISELKRAGAVDLVMAGAIRRPSLSELRIDWRGAAIMARILRGVGDDGLLRAIIRELEVEGFRLLSVSDLLGSAMAPLGVLGAHAPDDQAQIDIARGIDVGRVLGKLDVGQSVVIQQGLVLGVEAIEGTDALLDRVGPLRRAGPGGVLVKIVKPGQDRRADLPTIGPRTVAGAIAAGLRGIAIETGGVIILEPEACIKAADKAGLFLIGLGPAALGPAEQIPA